MGYPTNKSAITSAIRSALPDTSKWKTQTIEQLLFLWWQTGRGGRGLRLTTDGQEAFADAGVSKYRVEINSTIYRSALQWYTLISNLTKKLVCPYYIALRSESLEDKNRYPILWIYDHDIAVLIALYGDLTTYLESVKS